MDHLRYKKVDLHMHSLASDGVFAPAVLMQRAYENGVEVVALTDHDSLNGLDEARCEAVKLGMKFINGVELSVQWMGVPIHLVTLGFDMDNDAVNTVVNANQQVRIERGKTIAALLMKQGLPDIYEEALEEAGISQLGRPHFAKVLVKKGLVKDMNKAFDKHLNNKHLGGKLRQVWPELSDVVHQLNSSDVYTIVAHPKRYPLTVTKLKRMLTDFKVAGGKGIEVVSGNEKPDSVRLLERLSREYEFAASVGSDFHGPFGPWTEIGKYTPIHESEVSPIWYRWFA
ncbi:PHP domain-containing protein [Marinomonas mediterranea]|jgi:Predicted metal-dependent phosphoesterases (PHP family)|uniref:PHP domain protein n=1 Tax=Marinomonas mediterranea (strain ATCC 700492 / JCM 21426 / NBRC 103028 / MMB-1) TaxID=717774 RepID=F2K1J0_MARM1|nr:PHP domain-containing protein [Marinomonas mediterranea]ADZ92220.1 PHP domain protein [Marinomonas mediterranea MMB-1]WCN10178.1 PHP domain-containing protein [Marinomonas mediterranea]WCN14223.1 PHP domain-containing protein [Marinomonas mediterranea]WCN18279.1 PHP domain-containing protein [Marinomonas mediterranea MMB-1]